MTPPNAHALKRCERTGAQCLRGCGGGPCDLDALAGIIGKDLAGVGGCSPPDDDPVAERRALRTKLQRANDALLDIASLTGMDSPPDGWAEVVAHVEKCARVGFDREPADVSRALAQAHERGAATACAMVRSAMTTKGVEQHDPESLTYEPSRLPALVTALWRLTEHREPDTEGNPFKGETVLRYGERPAPGEGYAVFEVEPADEGKPTPAELAGPSWQREPQVDPETGVPWCTEACMSHDGKRCAITGNRPSDICEPAVRAMALNAPARLEPPASVCCSCPNPGDAFRECPVHGWED